MLRSLTNTSNLFNSDLSSYLHKQMLIEIISDKLFSEVHTLVIVEIDKLCPPTILTKPFQDYGDDDHYHINNKKAGLCCKSMHLIVSHEWRSPY